MRRVLPIVLLPSLLPMLLLWGCIALPEPLDAMEGAPEVGVDGGERLPDADEVTPDGGDDPLPPDGEMPWTDAGELEPDAGEPMPELCNGRDDDRDDSIDEGVQNDCGACGAPPAEVCDGFDNDCDLVIDEGAECACLPGAVERCGVERGACIAGERACGDGGRWGECSGVRPTGELCNDVDDDCDGNTDEGVANACRGCGPLPADGCNGVDDDCDGVIDGPAGGAAYAACDCLPGATRPCGTDTGRCGRGSEPCNAGRWGACEGAIGPRGELCDGVDDDCDGAIDEGACACAPGGTRACGSGEGRCEPGIERCGFEGWGACEGAIGPRAEQCDGVDDDCNGVADDGVPGGACGTGQPGVCAAGHQICEGGQPGCRRDVEPSGEACDGEDDDCDGRVDEGAANGQCATGQPGPCGVGERVCRGGAVVCEGRVMPGVEICDAIDNDCDGGVDEQGLALPRDCATGRPGACASGTPVCNGGVVACRAPSPRVEGCNGVDDDCDGATDEGTDGGQCATGQPGICAEGQTRCAGGAIQCVALAAPAFEGCNGEDDDCDGVVDEGQPTAEECEAGLPRPRYCLDGRLYRCFEIEP